MKTPLIFLILAMAVSVSAVPAIPFYGSILIDNQTAPAGTIVTLYINGTQVDKTTTPTFPELAANEYSLTAFGGLSGDIVTIEVYDLDAYNYTWNSVDEGIPQNVSFSVNRSVNGITCTVGQSCTSGICCAGTCQATCGTTVSYLGGGGGGGGGSRIVRNISTTPAPTPAPAPTPTFNVPPRTTSGGQNTPPTFTGTPIIPSRTTGNINPALPAGPEESLVPQATGLFTIGGRSVSTKQAIATAVFILALVGTGIWGYKTGAFKK